MQNGVQVHMTACVEMVSLTSVPTSWCTSSELATVCQLGKGQSGLLHRVGATKQEGHEHVGQVTRCILQGGQLDQWGAACFDQCRVLPSLSRHKRWARV